MDMNPVVSWMVMVRFSFCWHYSGYSQVGEEDLPCGVSRSDSREVNRKEDNILLEDPDDGILMAQWSFGMF